MKSRSFARQDSDPIYLVRTAGRLAQMLLEIRDEYATDSREDTLDQFERRLDELSALRDQLRELRAEREMDQIDASDEAVDRID